MAKQDMMVLVVSPSAVFKTEQVKELLSKYAEIIGQKFTDDVLVEVIARSKYGDVTVGKMGLMTDDQINHELRRVENDVKSLDTAKNALAGLDVMFNGLKMDKLFLDECEGERCREWMSQFAMPDIAFKIKEKASIKDPFHPRRQSKGDRHKQKNKRFHEYKEKNKWRQR